MRKNTETNFWINVDIGSDDVCWEWKTLSGTGKYAKTTWHGKTVRCHRKAYELFYKVEIPNSLLVCHKCDNPACCNPNHLFLGTNQDNVDDREKKGRNVLPRSKGEKHGIHKLTELQVKSIVKLYYGSYGHSYDSLSKKFKVSFGNIRKIVTGQTWGWLTGIKP